MCGVTVGKATTNEQTREPCSLSNLIMAAECDGSDGISANPAIGHAADLLATLADKFVCPTLKISTNSDLARRMPELIDFDTGPIITGSKTVEQMGEDMLELVIATASGEHTPKAVSLGQDDFLP